MSDLASYNDLENAVLNAVAAIHCLSVERNNLRHRLEANESEIGSLRDANEHLRRQIVLIGDSYTDYAASCANSLAGVALAMRAEPNAKAEASDAAMAFKGTRGQI
jgi:FtsZ-binding cell division protein ZapB